MVRKRSGIIILMFVFSGCRQDLRDAPKEVEEPYCIYKSTVPDRIPLMCNAEFRKECAEKCWNYWDFQEKIK